MSFVKLEIKLPPSLLVGRRRYFRKSEIDNLKTWLMSRGMRKTNDLPALEIDPADDKLVPAPHVMRDLGLARRTFYRKMKEADASPQAKAAKVTQMTAGKSGSR
jgi:hypothetical protein